VGVATVGRVGAVTLHVNDFALQRSGIGVGPRARRSEAEVQRNEETSDRGRLSEHPGG
jgi:hypothetical protein